LTKQQSASILSPRGPSRLIQGSKGAYPYHEGKHLIMALRQHFYGDESGVNDKRWCLIAGYRASPGQWEIFNREWNRALDGTGTFHAVDFFNRKRGGRKNPYRNLSDSAANALLSRLLGVITARRLTTVGSAVDVEAFSAFTWGEQSLLVNYFGGPSTRRHRAPAPYHYAFLTVLTAALRNTHPDTECTFVSPFRRNTKHVHTRLGRRSSNTMRPGRRSSSLVWSSGCRRRHLRCKQPICLHMSG
jgi:hypothetical protein